MPYQNQVLHLLVVEDNPGDFALLEAYLEQGRLIVERLCKAASLGEAAALLPLRVDLAFLDLSLPDSRGEDSFLRLQELLPGIPIVVLSGLADEDLALKCITLGAQDYLLKDDLDERRLEKSVVYSIERMRNLQKIAEANHQYELIGNITQDIIWNWQLETAAVTAQKTSFFGYGPGEVGSTLEWWVDKVHPEDYEKICSIISGVMEGRLEHLRVEYRFRSRQGDYRYVFNRGVLLRHPDGAPARMVGAIMDMTERKQLQDELLRTQVGLQKSLTEATIQGQEKEKEAIGKELHDNINQVLASTKLYLEVALTHGEFRQEMIGRVRENVLYAMEEIRRLSHSLIPPSLDDHGLIDSVKELADEFNRLGSFSVQLHTEGPVESVLDDAGKLMLYRVVQEALNNVVKYARATSVFISLCFTGGELRLTVTDNGVGFDTGKRSRGVGLRNIESRVAYYAGTMQLTSAPGQGTTLSVLLPVGSPG